MKNIIPKVFNSLTFLTHGTAFKAVCGVVAVFAAVCLFLCSTMLKKIPTKMAFFVDGISLKQERITIGEGSDISYKDVPKDYLTLTAGEDSVRWQVNPAYHDSDTLQYFKINEKNPNKIEIRNDASQRINMEIRSSVSGKDSTLTLCLTGEEVWNEWRNFDEQKEILLRHFAVRHQSDHAGYSARDPYGFMQQKNIRSFFSRKDKDRIYLVVLDRKIRVESPSTTFTYRFSGSCPTDMGTKVQFYRVNDYCYLDDSDDESFKVDSINYVMKASVKLTEWGAGHVMLYRREGAWNICFPKALGYVESLDTLYAMAHKMGDCFTLKQGKVSYPSKNDIYLPQISLQLPNEICSMEFHGDRMFVRKSYTDSVEVASKWNLSPALNRMELGTDRGRLQCRIGYVDRKFVSSYFLLPAFVVLVLVLFVIGPLSPVKLPKNFPYKVYSRVTVGNYRWYLSLLIAVAFCYCVCKTMIALKLSYTYPYFEKLTGIIPVSTSLMILLFFTVAMLINWSLVKASSGRYKRNRFVEVYPYLTIGVIAVLFGGIVYYFFGVLDPSVSRSVISSYYPSEINDWRFWKWTERVGINDTHRSVVFALMLAEGAALSAIVFLPWLKEAVTSIIKGCKSFGDRCYGLCEKYLLGSLWTGYENWSLGMLRFLTPSNIRVEKAELKCDDPKEEFRFSVWLGRALGRLPLVMLFLGVMVCVILLVLLGEGHFTSKLLFLAGTSVAFSLCLFFFKVIYIAFVKTAETLFSWHAVLLISLVVVGNIAGNFGTAFITLGVIIGLTQALSSVRFDNSNTPEQEGVQPLEGMWQMLFVTGAYIICAMMADNGYLTNYVGFLICLLTFYFLMEIPGWHNLLHNRIYKRTVGFVYLYLVVITVIILALPAICSRIYDPNEIHYDRMARRIMLFSNFDNIQNSGFRYTETDAEFMVVMNHNMQHPFSGDPLSNDLHILHPSVSTGQSPVVLNDLSMPVAFFGSYGTMRTTAVFFLLLLLMLGLVMQYSIHSDNEREPVLSRQMQWRLMAVFMWTGTTLYIYLSYLGRIPFTGRLIPGFGVDAVGEVLETALLFAFMAAVAFRTERSTLTNSQQKAFSSWTMDDF